MAETWKLAIIQAFTARLEMKIEQMANFSELTSCTTNFEYFINIQHGADKSNFPFSSISPSFL
jgi:hypothetical protein